MKLLLVDGGARAVLAFPLSKGSGSIEATAGIKIAARLAGFPLSKGSSSIEADSRFYADSPFLDAIPLSKGSGSIEAGSDRTDDFAVCFASETKISTAQMLARTMAS